MSFADVFLSRYKTTPKTLEQQLEYATSELHHYLRPYHDMEFMERQAIHFAKRVTDLRTQIETEKGTSSETDLRQARL